MDQKLVNIEAEFTVGTDELRRQVLLARMAIASDSKMFSLKWPQVTVNQPEHGSLE